MVSFNEKVPHYVESLTSIQRSRYWVHEDVVLRRIGLKATSEVGRDSQPRQRLTDIIGAIGKGYVGNKKAKTHVDTGHSPFDLRDETNDEGIFFVEHGAKDKAHGGRGHGRPARWFALVESIEDAKGESVAVPMVDIDLQLSVVRDITGTAPHLAKAVVERRRAIWPKWWQGRSGGGRFKSIDVPLIAKKYADAFSCDISDDVNWTRDALLLRIVESEMKEMVRSSGEAGLASKRPDTSSTQLRRPAGSPLNNSSAEATAVQSPARSARSQSSTSSSSSMDDLPEALRLSAISCQTSLGEEYVEKVKELASIELAVKFAKDITDNGELITLGEKMEKAGVPAPRTISTEDIQSMGTGTRGAALRNIVIAKGEILFRMGGIEGIFAPVAEKDREGKINDTDDNGCMKLYAWLEEGRRFTRGKRVAAENYKSNKDRCKELELTDEASHILRHIISVFDIHPTKIPGLWACFYVLILRKEMPLDEFSSPATIQRHMMRISDIDKAQAAQEFEKFICRLSPHGFHRYW